jgi:hypothetical protein
MPKVVVYKASRDGYGVVDVLDSYLGRRAAPRSV